MKGLYTDLFRLPEAMDRVSQPSVSIVLPVYNGEKYIRDAIASVFCQRCDGLELIVVDDGSTDATAAILNEYGDAIRYVRQANAGASEARNVGLSLASSSLIGFIDADDLWPIDKLSRQTADLTSNDDVRVVLGKTQLFQMNDHSLSAAKFFLPSDSVLDLDSDSDSDLVSRECVAGNSMRDSGSAGTKSSEEITRSVPTVSYLLGAALFRRDVIDQVGRFNPELSIAHDTDWFMRLRELGITIFHEDFVSLHYRRNPEGLTADKQLLEKEMFSVFRMSLDRRRKPGQVEAKALTAEKVLNSVQPVQ